MDMCQVNQTRRVVYQTCKAKTTQNHHKNAQGAGQRQFVAKLENVDLLRDREPTSNSTQTSEILDHVVTNKRSNEDGPFRFKVLRCVRNGTVHLRSPMMASSSLQLCKGSLRTTSTVRSRFEERVAEERPA